MFTNCLKTLYGNDLHPRTERPGRIPVILGGWRPRPPFQFLRDSLSTPISGPPNRAESVSGTFGLLAMRGCGPPADCHPRPLQEPDIRTSPARQTSRTMATLDAHFEALHARIALDQSRRDRVTSAHTTLRERLRARPQLEAKLKGVFLQGSYVQHTAVRPRENGKFDVDVVLAMDLAENIGWGFREPRDPRSTMEWVARRLREIPAYAGKVHQRGRCVRIEFSEGFHMDVVPAHARSTIPHGAGCVAL